MRYLSHGIGRALHRTLKPQKPVEPSYELIHSKSCRALHRTQQNLAQIRLWSLCWSHSQENLYSSSSHPEAGYAYGASD